MFPVEIKAGEVSEKPYDFTNDRGERVTGVRRTQVGWLGMPGKPYPVEIEVKLAAEQPPYKPGKYRLSADSFRIDRARLSIMRVILSPEAGTARAA